MSLGFTDCMVDLETTSTLPDRGAIISVSAVRFNPKTRDVDPHFFDRCLFIPPTRGWSESTREWWLNQKRSILQDIWRRMEEPAVVWRDFCDWAYPVGSLRFWSKPSHFDFNFVSSYCHDYDLVNPFDFREANDLRSFLRGLYFPDPVPDLRVEFDGDAHNSLMDVLHQIKFLYAHLDHADVPKLVEGEVMPCA